MASDPFYSSVITRRSIYAITDSSPIPDSRIAEIVEKAIKYVPSSFNVQSARAVVLLKAEHKKLWSFADEAIKGSLPEEIYKQIGPRIVGFQKGYGTVLFFEDQSDLEGLKQKHQSVAPFAEEWSNVSSGMHQFTVWTALAAEGLGASLQHYNFSPVFCAKVQEEWGLPTDWQLKAQLVFGTPTAQPLERVSKPVEDRFKMFGQ